MNLKVNPTRLRRCLIHLGRCLICWPYWGYLVAILWSSWLMDTHAHSSKHVLTRAYASYFRSHLAILWPSCGHHVAILWSSWLMDTHIHRYTHARAHAYIHRYTYTQTHIHIYTYTYTYTYTTHIQRYTYVCKYTWTRAHACTYTYICTYTHIHINTYTHADLAPTSTRMTITTMATATAITDSFILPLTLAIYPYGSYLHLLSMIIGCCSHFGPSVPHQGVGVSLHVEVLRCLVEVSRCLSTSRCQGVAAWRTLGVVTSTEDAVPTHGWARSG